MASDSFNPQNANHVAVSSSPGVSGTTSNLGGSLFSPDDESIWLRYSSHYEFPMSVAASVVLHIFVAMMVVLAGVWLINWGEGKPPEVDTISFGGGGGAGEGGGDPDGPEMLQEAVSFNDDDLDQKLDTPPDTNVLPTESLDEKQRLVDKVKENEQLAKGIADKSKLAGDIGRGGPGRGGGKGSGFGRGEGDGVGDGKGNARTRRKDRWTIIMPANDSAMFIDKLIELQTVLVLPDGPGKFKIYDDLSKRPASFRSETVVGINRMNRIWFTNRDRDICRGVASELGLTEQPDFVAIFIPQELEQELFKKELAFRGLTEEKLDAQKMMTLFDVTRRGTTWDVRVREQKPRTSR